MRTVLAAAAVLLAGCSAQPGPASSPNGGTVTVLAAASLSGVMTTLTTQFEKEHPGTTVRVTTGGSSDLVAQLAGGLPADVLATADRRTMTSARDQGLVTTPTAISTNTLTLVTAPGNPLHLTNLADAGRHDLVVCAQPVPCGAATARVAAAERVAVRARSEEQNVTSVLEKVRSGQADAGVVYVTDARRAGSAVTAVDLPGAKDVVTTQMAAATPHASAGGAAFLALLTGPAGRAALAKAGFGAP